MCIDRLTTVGLQTHATIVRAKRNIFSEFSFGGMFGGVFGGVPQAVTVGIPPLCSEDPDLSIV